MPGASAQKGPRAQRARQTATTDLPGWDRLRHGGLLFDGTRLASLSGFIPDPLDDYTASRLRQRANAILNNIDGTSTSVVSSFVTFVLEQVCGLDASTGNWSRGTSVNPSWGRRGVVGETVKPRHLWKGRRGALLPVFLDDTAQSGTAKNPFQVKGRLGIGKSRRIISQALGWLRAGHERLALVTNGRQWRLLFAGPDFEAWCEWDLELWFEAGELSPQVTALRTLLCAELWTPPKQDAAPPLLQAVRDTRKGQAELSEVLGERVREAVEILIQGHGEALRALLEGSSLREYSVDDAVASLVPDEEPNSTPPPPPPQTSIAPPAA